MRVLLIFFLFSLPLTAYSEDYYWIIGSATTPQYPSAAAALSALESTSPNSRFDVYNKTDTTWSYRTYRKSDGGYTGFGSINRRGSTCTEPNVYNPQTGGCEPPSEPENPCGDKVGDSEPFSKTGTRGDGFYDTINVGGKNMGVTPDSACLGGCTAFLNQSCVFTISANRYSCSGRAYFTGDQCTAGPTSVDSSPTVREEDPEVTNDEEPCVYVQDAEGRSHCVSKQSVEQEGQNCGTAGPSGSEQVKCYPKEAKKDESKTETEVTEKPTPDGGKETVKKDVHTETKCTGNNQNCTTTTTTTTTTTKADGSGKTTSTVVTCKGAKCGEDGKGGGGGGGGAPSGGLEGCTDNDCSGSGGSGSGGPDLEEAPGYDDSLGQYFARIQAAPIVSAVTSISIPSGGNCPVFSETIEYIGAVSTSTACSLADSLLGPLRYLFLAIWAFVAIRTTMTA